MADPKKGAPDWERIENDYRAGLLSGREIAAAQGVSHVAIGKRAKREGWTRDLAAKIKAKAEALVTSRTVTKEVTAERAVTDQALIEANAEVIATVRLNHRKDIGRARTLAMSLLDELTHQSGNQELYQELAELLLDADDAAKDSAAQSKRWQAFQAAMSLGVRTKVMKDLGDTLHKLVSLEREAYGIDDKRLPPSGSNEFTLTFV